MIHHFIYFVNAGPEVRRGRRSDLCGLSSPLASLIARPRGRLTLPPVGSIAVDLHRAFASAYTLLEDRIVRSSTAVSTAAPRGLAVDFGTTSAPPNGARFQLKSLLSLLEREGGEVPSWLALCVWRRSPRTSRLPTVFAASSAGIWGPTRRAT
jgi:hypothetical protein